MTKRLIAIAAVLLLSVGLIGSQGVSDGITDSWLQAVALGKVEGYTIIHKFGEGAIGTTIQPVTTTGTYMTPTSAAALEILSDDPNDRGADPNNLGIGAQEVTIVGLDPNWNELTQTATLNGTTAVDLTTNLTRVYRAYVSATGTYATSSAGSHQGTITIRADGGGATWAQIGLGPDSFPEGQTQIAVYSVGKNKTVYLLGADIQVDGSKASTVMFFRRCDIDDVTSPYSGAMRVNLKMIGVVGALSLDLESPVGPYAGPCDIGWMADATASGTDVSVDFELLVVDD